MTLADPGWRPWPGFTVWTGPPKRIPIHLRFLPEAVNHNAALVPTTPWVWSLKDIDLLAEPKRKPLVVMKDERFYKQFLPD